MDVAVFGARCTLRYEMDLQFFNVTGNSKMLSLPGKKKDRAFVVVASCNSLRFGSPLYTLAFLAAKRLEETKKENGLDGGARECG